MDARIGQNTERVTGLDPAQRSTALAEARKRSSAAALQNAEAAESRKADQREMVRAILERAVGANTRVSIARQESDMTFVYRAIDVETGEVVREWPPADFAKLLEKSGATAGLAEDVMAGLAFDEQA